VKAPRSGSSIDVYVCHEEADAIAKTRDVLSRVGYVMVEQFIKGTELTVGILEDRALSPIRIAYEKGFFDYESKYGKNGARHAFDLNVPDAVAKHCQEVALKAHQVLGAQDLSRLDIMVDQQHRPYLIEINTLPGFTPRSLLPDAANHDGIPFLQLVDRLVSRAHARGPRSA
jgi:D-alanine-D-alanine ligase